MNDAAPLIQTMLTVTQEHTAQKSDVSLFAIEQNSVLMPKIIEGKSLSGSGRHEVVVDASLKEDGVKLGDVLTIKDTTAAMSVVAGGRGRIRCRCGPFWLGEKHLFIDCRGIAHAVKRTHYN